MQIVNKLDTECMQKLSITTTFALAAALLIAPATALGCNIAFRTIGPVTFAKSEIKRPIERSGSRSRWQLQGDWVGTRPELNQIVKVRGVGAVEGVSFSRQSSLSIDAAAPSNNGWLYADDDLDSTPPCEIAGTGEWQLPVVLVREDRREVRIAAAAQLTPGSRFGCVLGGDDAAWGCPTLTRTVVKLDRPIGSRRLVFEELG